MIFLLPVFSPAWHKSTPAPTRITIILIVFRLIHVNFAGRNFFKSCFFVGIEPEKGDFIYCLYSKNPVQIKTIAQIASTYNKKYGIN